MSVRFLALGHRIPVEAGLLAFWRTRNQRAVIVASLAHRIGLISDEGLALRVFAICVYGQAQQVLAEGVEIATAAEQREQLQLRRSAA